MSDADTARDENVQKLERVHRSLRLNSIFFWIGILIMATALLIDIFDKDNTIKTGVLFLPSWLILSGLRVFSVIFGGLGTLFRPDYITVTTYSDGSRVTSSQSLGARIFSRFMGILIGLFIGPFVTCIHLIVLICMYSILKATTRAKSTIVPSGLVIIIIDLVLIAGFITLIIFAWFK